MLKRLLIEGGQWIGRRRPLTEREFRHAFGVYPRTVEYIANLGFAVDIGVDWLLKSLWWMKEYPTDQIIINHGASATYFRQKRWNCLEALRDRLPEVC